MPDKIIKSEAEWKNQLTPIQYNILRERGTEKAFSEELFNYNEVGIYFCVACDNPLFFSGDRFDSKTGWPSFSKPISDNSLILNPGNSDGAEVLCSKCEGHLGHIFFDGPKPSGKRFCINSAVLVFKKV